MKVTIKELRNIIPTIGTTITPIIQSEPGCGKTSLLKMLESDLGDKYDYIYVDCPVKDMSDIAMTIPNHDTKSLEHYVGTIFKLDSNKPKVILLDEFMKAPKLLQVMFTRLMLERTIGDTPLPEGSIVFGTSNNQSDGVGDGMLAHSGNRVCIMRMEKPSVDEWLVWATENSVSHLVRAFVHTFPRCLASYLDEGQENNPYIFNPKKQQLSFVSPRSLDKCSVIVENHEKLGDNATMCALSGTIGQSASVDFSAFLRLEKDLPVFTDIITSPMSAKIPEQKSAQLMLMFQAVDKMDNSATLTSFMKYLNRIESNEMQAVFFSMITLNSKTVKIARNNPEIAKWAKENHYLF
tara:strand:- start:4992 stop:6044 length:1053 start_codon:yes stop_codon:yes gene_type:complete